MSICIASAWASTAGKAPVNTLRVTPALHGPTLRPVRHVSTHRARAFLEEVARLPEDESLPGNATFDDGVHNMETHGAVAVSAANNGEKVSL